MNRVDQVAGARRWGPPLLLAALATLYLWEVVALVGVPVARDMQLFFVPQKHLLWEALRAGDLPLWTPYVGTGAPFLANFQTGVFYPPHWGFAALPFLEGFNLLVVLHFLAGALFSWAFARELGLDRIPAFAAAATWTFGGYFASLLNLMNALQAAAWAPAIAFALLRHLDRRSAASWLLLVAVTLGGLLAGEPQSFLLAGLTATFAAGLRLARRPEDRARLLRWSGGVVVAAVLVLGLAAAQLLPTLEFLAESNRGTAGLPYGEVSGFALEPIRLLYLLVPPDYGDPQFAFGVRSLIGQGGPWLFSIYLGPVWLLLLWFAWRNRERRREVVAWTAVALVGVIVGLGPHTPLFPWLYEHVPPVRSFRFPEKYFFLTAFAASVLAGYGTDAVLRRRSGRADAPAAFLFLGLLAAARLAFARSRQALESYAGAHFGNRRMMLDFDFVYGVWGDNLTRLLVIAALALLLVALHRRGHLRTPVFGALLAGLLAGDLVTAHRDLNPVVERTFYERTPMIAESVPFAQVRVDYRYRFTDFGEQAGRVLQRAEASLEAQKWLWQQTLAPNVGQLWGVLQTDTWDAIKLRRYEDERTFLRILPQESHRWRLLRIASVRYLYSAERLDAQEQAVERGLDPALPGYLYELVRPLPRAYVVGASHRVRDDEAAINAVLAPDFDPRQTVVLVDSATAPSEAPGTSDSAARSSPGGRESGATVHADRPAAAGTARITGDAGDALRIRLDGTGEGHLVLTDSYFPGWHAYVDGEERPIELANFFFRAVEVRRGDRDVVFRYEPRSFVLGGAISLATLLAALGIASGRFLLRRRQGAKTSARA